MTLSVASRNSSCKDFWLKNYNWREVLAPDVAAGNHYFLFCFPLSVGETTHCTNAEFAGCHGSRSAAHSCADRLVCAAGNCSSTMSSSPVLIRVCSSYSPAYTPPPPRERAKSDVRHHKFDTHGEELYVLPVCIPPLLAAILCHTGPCLLFVPISSTRNRVPSRS